MKKLLTISILLATLAGCKKDLTLTDPDHATAASFWKTATDAQQGVAAIYSTYHRVGLARNLYFFTMIQDRKSVV